MMISKRWMKIGIGASICACACSLSLAQTVTAEAAETGTTVTGSSATQPVDPAIATTHDNSFVIGNDDVLSVNVWKEPEVSRSVPVRSDGKISLPLAGEVQAAGMTPLKLEQDIAARLKNYMSEPGVTVIVQQINSKKFNVLGQVIRPGSYPVTNSPTVLDAIAIAGGFKDFAKRTGVYVLRQNPDGSQSRLPFNYKRVIKGRGQAENVKLQPRDTVVVP